MFDILFPGWSWALQKLLEDWKCGGTARFLVNIVCLIKGIPNSFLGAFDYSINLWCHVSTWGLVWLRLVHINPKIRLVTRSITHASPVIGSLARFIFPTQTICHCSLPQMPWKLWTIFKHWTNLIEMLSANMCWPKYTPGLPVRGWSASQLIRMRRSTSLSRCQLASIQNVQNLPWQNCNINISGDQSEVSEKQDGPNSGGDKEVYTGEGKLMIKISMKVWKIKMISKYFTCVLSGIRTQVAAKTGTDQTIFDSAQLEVRDSDSGSFDDCDCDPKHWWSWSKLSCIIKIWSCRWRREWQGRPIGISWPVRCTSPTYKHSRWNLFQPCSNASKKIAIKIFFTRWARNPTFLQSTRTATAPSPPYPAEAVVRFH